MDPSLLRLEVWRSFVGLCLFGAFFVVGVVCTHSRTPHHMHTGIQPAARSERPRAARPLHQQVRATAWKLNCGITIIILIF